MYLRLIYDYEFDCFGINLEHCLVLRDGESIAISPTAFKILQLLVENRHRIVTNSELKGIWESQKTNVNEDANIQQHISKLKKALGLKPDGKPYIKNYPKGAHRKSSGYQFTGDVRTLSEQAQELGISDKTYLQVESDVRSDYVEESNNRKKDGSSEGLHEGGIVTLPLRLPSDKIFIARLPRSGPNLFGRDAELRQLDEAWETSNTNIIIFIASGGAGKTALINHWRIRHMVPDHYRGAEHVYSWSFCSQGTSERADSADLFIDQALRWFGGDEVADTLTAASPWDKGERLAHLIRQTRTLLILDGLEPLQYRPGHYEGFLKDAALQTLLVELAEKQPGLCVISTRERVSDLVEFENGTVIQHDLDQLSLQAGAQLLRALNVKGDDDELEQAVKEYDGHALALTLLGSYLTDVYASDVRRRNEIESLEEDVRHGGHAEQVMRAYEKWLGESVELTVLRLLGLFDRPADASSIAVLRAGPIIPGLTESLQDLKQREWQQALAKLRRINLLNTASASEPDILDAHPLVRVHFKRQLKQERPDAWREANNRLYEHLNRTAKENPDTVKEISPLFAAVSHGCEAGKHQEALNEVFQQRIQRGNPPFSIIQLGMFSANLAALFHFFKTPWRQPVEGLNDDDKGFVMQAAGYCLRALGRLQEVEQPMQASLEMQIARKNWKLAAIFAGNLSEVYIVIGNLPQAVKFAQQSVELADRDGDESLRKASYTALVDALYQMGHTEEAAATFRKAEMLKQQLKPEYPFLFAMLEFVNCNLLLGQGKVQEVKERAVQALEISTRNNWLLNIALDTLSLGRAWLLEAQQVGADDTTQAAEFLLRALDGLRRAGRMDLLPHGQLSRAAFHRISGDYEQAEHDLAKMLRIATRGGMGLHLADYHLESVRLGLAQGNQNKACEHLATAREMVERMDYHRRDSEIKELSDLLP